MKVPAAVTPVARSGDESSGSSKGEKLLKHDVTPPVATDVKPAPPPSPAQRVGTKRATAQFKSPLLTGASNTTFAVRLTPTIQSLQRDVQMLKRAIKVRQEGEEGDLERLVRKWTEAGREVAYELWGLVKDNESGDRNVGIGGRAKGGFEGNWGWENKGGADRGWGFGDMPQTGLEEVTNDQQTRDEGLDGEDETRSDTLGTMLRQLGIAPETLGWDEEEGGFAGE